MSCTHIPGPERPASARPEASPALAKSKSSLSVPVLGGVQEPGSQDPSPSVGRAQPPRPHGALSGEPEAWGGLPQVGQPPQRQQGCTRSCHWACLLSVPKPRYAVWDFFPPSLMFYSCKPSLHLSSENEREDAGERGRDRGAQRDWGARRGDLTYVWVLLLKAR